MKPVQKIMQQEPKGNPEPDESRLLGVLANSLGCYYWEQDENFRFNLFAGPGSESGPFNPKCYLGKTRWELSPKTVEMVGAGTSTRHCWKRENRLPTCW